MAAVPIQEPARAAKVLEHAVIELGFRGAYIATNVNHRYYDSEDFDPFWAKAEELDVLVFMHPDNPAGTELMGSFGLRLVCGNPADTTLSLGLLIYSGVFDRFPNLKLCTCHGGGFFPYHVSRFDREFVTGQQATRRAGRPDCAKCASATERVSQKPILRYAGLRRGNPRLSPPQSRRGAFNARHRLPLCPRRLAMRRQNRSARIARKRKSRRYSKATLGSC